MTPVSESSPWAGLASLAKHSVAGVRGESSRDALEHAGCEARLPGRRVRLDANPGRSSTPASSSCCPATRSWSGAWIALGRSLRHLIDVIAKQREIAFRSLRESIDTSTATGRLQLHLFAALAEFDRERSASGQPPDATSPEPAGARAGAPA